MTWHDVSYKKQLITLCSSLASYLSNPSSKARILSWNRTAAAPLISNNSGHPIIILLTSENHRPFADWSLSQKSVSTLDVWCCRWRCMLEDIPLTVQDWFHSLVKTLVQRVRGGISIEKSIFSFTSRWALMAFMSSVSQHSLKVYKERLALYVLWSTFFLWSTWVELAPHL